LVSLRISVGLYKGYFFLSITPLFLYIYIYIDTYKTYKKKKDTPTSSVIYYKSMAVLVHILKMLSYWSAAEAPEKHKQTFLIR